VIILGYYKFSPDSDSEKIQNRSIFEEVIMSTKSVPIFFFGGGAPPRGLAMVSSGLELA